MNLFKLIGELVVIYILYKLIFDFIVPLYSASKQMKGKMNDMQAKMRQQQRQNEEQNRQHEKRSTAASKPVGEDYIEYEEIKN